MLVMEVGVGLTLSGRDVAMCCTEGTGEGWRGRGERTRHRCQHTEAADSVFVA